MKKTKLKTLKDLRYNRDDIEKELTIYNRKTGKIINVIPYEFVEKNLKQKLKIK